VACLLTQAATAAVALPWPTQPLTEQPPLTPSTVRVFANTFRGRVAATATVRVGLEGGGSVRTVSVTQRLVVGGPGDYLLTVPAPARTVVRAAGSESEPGRRRNALVWQGFSAGRRVLAATLQLRTAAAQPALPLGVRLSGSTASWSLSLENRTGASVASFRGTASPAAVDRYLRALRSAPHAAPPGPVPFAEVEGIEPGRRTVLAPLRVRGVATFPGGRAVRIDEMLAGGFPARVRIALPAGRRPRLELRVDPVRPDRLLRTARTLDAAIAAALAHSLARQYESFLANPDPAGRSLTSYLYATAPAPQEAPGGAERGEGAPWSALVAALLLVVAAGAGIVVWSRS
jgi:hypothetical protein